MYCIYFFDEEIEPWKRYIILVGQMILNRKSEILTHVLKTSKLFSKTTPCWVSQQIFPANESYSVMFNSLQPHWLNSPWDSPGQNTGVGSLSLLQEIFPTHESNTGLPHCRWILYQLSHKGNPRILECIVCPFSSESSRSRKWTGVPCNAGEFFTNWAMREALDTMLGDW